MPAVITSKQISGDPIRALALLTSGIYGTHTENDSKCKYHFYATTNQLEEPVKLSAILAQRLFQTVLFSIMYTLTPRPLMRTMINGTMKKRIVPSIAFGGFKSPAIAVVNVGKVIA